MSRPGLGRGCIYAFYIDVRKKLNIEQVQKGRISMYSSQWRHVVASLRMNQPPRVQLGV